MFVGLRSAVPLIVTLGLAGSLAGCGFTPLYATHGGDAAANVVALSQVSVALLPDRSGQMLREDLQDRLEAGGAEMSSRYDLYVSLSIAPGAIAIDQQSASTRTRMSGSASWTLKGQDAGHTTLAAGAARSLDGYDIINQQFFAADQSAEAATQRIDAALADQITQQLAIYFKQHPPGV